MSERAAADTTFTVAGVGDHTVTAYRWDPEGAPRVIVQLTHGMGEHAQRYGHLARTLTARGAVVVAQDHRGHGASMVGSRAPGDLGPGGWAALVEEIGLLTAATRAEFPDLPLVLLGHSMGSFAVQQHLLRPGVDADAVVLTGTAALDLLEPALDLDQPIELSAFNAPFAPARTDHDWLSRDEAQVDAYVADPLCGFGLDQESGRQMFERARPVADPAALGVVRRDLPLLVAVGEADPVNAGLALVGPLVQRYRGVLDDVTLVTYPAARHEILNETNRDEVEADLVGWIAARTPLRAT